MALEAPRLSLRCKVLDAGGAKAPCAGISEEGWVEGGLKDEEKLKELAKGEKREGMVEGRMEGGAGDVEDIDSSIPTSLFKKNSFYARAHN